MVKVITKIEIPKIVDELIVKKANDETSLQKFCDFVKKTTKLKNLKVPPPRV